MSNTADKLNECWEQSTEFSNVEVTGNLHERYSLIIFLILLLLAVYQRAGSMENSSKLGIEGHFLNFIKTLYQKTYSKHQLKGKKLEAFPLKSGIRQRCPLSPLLFNIILEVLADTIKQEKEIKHIEIEKEGNSEDLSCITWVKSTHPIPSRILSIPPNPGVQLSTSSPRHRTGKAHHVTCSNRKSKHLSPSPDAPKLYFKSHCRSQKIDYFGAWICAFSYLFYQEWHWRLCHWRIPRIVLLTSTQPIYLNWLSPAHLWCLRLTDLLFHESWPLVVGSYLLLIIPRYSCSCFLVDCGPHEDRGLVCLNSKLYSASNTVYGLRYLLESNCEVYTSSLNN